MFSTDVFTPWVLLTDLGIISALILVGKFIRVKVKLIQQLFIPPSLIAGVLGLAFGPNGLGWLPFSGELGTYASILIAIVLLVSGYFYIENHYIKPNRRVEGVMKRATVWVSRVDNMVEELKTPTDSVVLTDDNYQRSIAKMAIARGGLSPVGVLPGNSQGRNILPQAFADYIFAIIIEESGIIGAVFLMLLYLAILFRSCLSSSKYADYAAMLMVMGLALMLTCQALVSMMVAVGIGPVTGQPLPLISRGGTSVLITSLYFGIIMCVAREQNELQARQQSATIESEEDVPEIHIE